MRGEAAKGALLYVIAAVLVAMPLLVDRRKTLAALRMVQFRT